jgi:Zn-dependent alcohol dehydrogenase
MKTEALVASGAGLPLSFQQIDLSPLRPNECLVQMVATGICHTDLKAQEGNSIVKFPIILGHEGIPIPLK